MKIRLIKKHAKARNTYGFCRIGLKLEMQEIASYAFLRKKGNMRFYTHYTHRNQKLFRKHTGLPKNRYYSFYLITQIEKINRPFQLLDHANQTGNESPISKELEGDKA